MIGRLPQYATIIYQYCNIAWLILNLKLITEKYKKTSILYRKYKYTYSVDCRNAWSWAAKKMFQF